VPILMLATWFVYLPPESGAGPAYFVFWMVLFYVGATILQISRNAWVTDIAAGYDDRSRYFEVIEIISVLSMLFLLLLPVFLADPDSHGSRRDQIAAMGLCLIISLPITAGLAVFLVPDKPDLKRNTAESFTPAALKQAFRNPQLARLLGLEVLVGIAVTVTASLYLFIADSVFGLSDQQASLLLVAYFIASVIGLRLWMWLAARTEKGAALRIALLMSAATYACYFVGAQFGGFSAFALAAILNGFGFTAPFVIGRSMTADLVACEEAENGHNRSGLFFAMNSAAYKIGASVAVALAYWLAHYVAGYEAGADNSPESVRGLLFIFCIVPSIFFIAAWALMRRYTLTRSEVARRTQTSAT
jgi:glycoside/pentoside/hexuronide:cation symporter, GPH family